MYCVVKDHQGPEPDAEPTLRRWLMPRPGQALACLDKPMFLRSCPRQMGLATQLLFWSLRSMGDNSAKTTVCQDRLAKPRLDR